jgi:BMFP domain-containing protein YqiC
VIDPKIIDEIAQKISEVIPENVKQLKSDMERNVRATVEKSLNQFNLISREEFDIQQQVLARTREKLEALEKRLQELEEQHKNS